MKPFTQWFIDTIENADDASPEAPPELMGLLGREYRDRLQSAVQAVLIGELTAAESLKVLDEELQQLIDRALEQYA